MENILNLLKNREYTQIVSLCQKERRCWSFLKSRLYDPDILIKYRAVEAVGLYMKEVWKEDKERVRVFIRTLLWSLNDESGGIGWSSAPAIGEIIHHVPELKDPYLSMAMNALDERLLQKPILWAVARVGERSIDDVMFHRENFLACFESNDLETVGYAFIASIKSGFREGLNVYAKKFSECDFNFDYFVDGYFVRFNIKNLIREHAK